MNLNERHADFFQRVYAVCRLIPTGRVTNYGAIAKALGAERSSRMVGWAMNAVHGLSDVPAHRVVNRNGLLTGKMHFTTPNRMQELLEQERIFVVDDKVQNFKALFWDPSTEIQP